MRAAGGGAPINFPGPPDLRGLDPRQSYNATSLAFLGDAVWELFWRSESFYPPRPAGEMHRRAKHASRAETQCGLHALLRGAGVLTDGEQDVLRWGRNASVRPPRGLERRVYSDATAVECLVGYLWLTDPGRLREVLSWAFAHVGSVPGAGGAGEPAGAPGPASGG